MSQREGLEDNGRSSSRNMDDLKAGEHFVALILCLFGNRMSLRLIAKQTNHLKRRLMNHILSAALGMLTVIVGVPCLPTKATTIVVARSANEIVIGADSKVTDTYGDQRDTTVCKIQQAGNLFIAFQGLLRDKKTGFNVTEVAIKALQLMPDASAAERVGIMTGFLTSHLFRELQLLRTNSPEEFQRKLEGQTFLRIVIAGFEGNRPVLFVRQFRTTIFSGKIGLAVFPDDCVEECEGEVVLRFLGETEAIDGLTEETAGFWNNGLVSGVRRLIEIEIEARDEHVGPPIDILQIKPDGARWIQKKPECSPIRPPRGYPSVRRRRR